MLLELFSRFGQRASRYKALFWWLALATTGVFIIGLFAWRSPGGEAYALLAITVCVWMLLLIVVAETFSRPLPHAHPSAPWRARARVRLARAGLWLLALLMTALCGFVLLFSFRALGVLLRGGG